MCKKKDCTGVTRKKTTCIGIASICRFFFFPILYHLFSREAIPISYRALRDKLGDGSVIIPSRIRTRSRLRIHVALHFFPFFLLLFFTLPFFISLFPFFFYRTLPSELNAQLRRLSPRCNPQERYTPAVIFTFSLSLSLFLSLSLSRA